MLFTKLSFGSQVSEEFSSGDVGHQEVQVARVLWEAFKTNLLFEEIISILWKSYEEWVVDVWQDVVFRNHMVDLS